MYLCMPLRAQISVYHPFPDSDAVWCDDSGRHICPFLIEPDVLIRTTYQLNGKYDIDSITYNRLSSYRISTYYFNCDTPSRYIDTTTYYFRQDTAQKKVFLYNFSSHSDSLLYDFNLQVGDTLTQSRISWGSTNLTQFPYIVTSIDSVLIGGQFRKRFNYQQLDSSAFCAFEISSMIEGIGCISGLMNGPGCFETFANLQEFIQDNIVLVGSSATVFYYCPDYTFIDEAKNSSEKNAFLTLSPNPTSSTFTITTTAQLQNAQVEIYNVVGVAVQSEFINKKSEMSVEVSALPPGIYFVKVKGDKWSAVQKLVIQ